jgi:hypothetical protein
MVPPPPLYASPRYSAIVHAASAAVLPQPSEVPTWAQELWAPPSFVGLAFDDEEDGRARTFSFFYVNYIRMNEVFIELLRGF